MLLGSRIITTLRACGVQEGDLREASGTLVMVPILLQFMKICQATHFSNTHTIL